MSYCAIRDRAFFWDRVLAAVGGGDSAVQEASYLTRYARRVYVLHRRDAWRAQRTLREGAHVDPKIRPIWGAVVEEIGGADRVQWVHHRSVRTAEPDGWPWTACSSMPG